MKKLLTASIATVIALSTLPYAEAADTKNPYGTAVVDPAGPNEIILSISKGKERADFTLSRLQKIKSKTITIYEPFVKKHQTFTVIPLKTIFGFVGISGKDRVSTRALNDYIYTNTAEKFLAADGYLAIKRNGADIPYDQGGPIRIIFPNTSKWANFLDAWNWSIATISVR